MKALQLPEYKVNVVSMCFVFIKTCLLICQVQKYARDDNQYPVHVEMKKLSNKTNGL